MATVDTASQAPGSATGTSANVDAAFSALRVSVRPYDHTIGGQVQGHFKVFANSAAGAIAAGIQGVFRNAGATGTSVAVIQRVYAIITVATAVTAQAIAPLTAKIVRAYSTGDVTNGTSLTLKGNDQAMRTGMGNIAQQVVTVATAPGTVLSGGNGTVDDNPFAAIAINGLAALGSAVQADLYKADKFGEHPLILGPQEGIQLIWGTTLATGTATFGFGVDFALLAQF